MNFAQYNCLDIYVNDEIDIEESKFRVWNWRSNIFKSETSKRHFWRIEKNPLTNFQADSQ